MQLFCLFTGRAPLRCPCHLAAVLCLLCLQLAAASPQGHDSWHTLCLPLPLPLPLPPCSKGMLTRMRPSRDEAELAAAAARLGIGTTPRPKVQSEPSLEAGPCPYACHFPGSMCLNCRMPSCQQATLHCCAATVCGKPEPSSQHALLAQTDCCTPCACRQLLPCPAGHRAAPPCSDELCHCHPRYHCHLQ